MLELHRTISAEEDLTLEAARKRQIERVLTLTKGVKRQAAEVLGVSRNTLDNLIDRYAIRCEAG